MVSRVIKSIILFFVAAKNKHILIYQVGQTALCDIKANRNKLNFIA